MNAHGPMGQKRTCGVKERHSIEQKHSQIEGEKREEAEEEVKNCSFGEIGWDQHLSGHIWVLCWQCCLEQAEEVSLEE